MLNFDAIFESLQKSAKNAQKAETYAGIYHGVVEAINPLKIKIEQLVTLPAEFFTLTSLVKDFDIDMEMTVDHSVEDTSLNAATLMSPSGPVTGALTPNPHKHNYKGKKTFTMHVKLGLQVGEKVIMVRDHGGQKFLIVDRVREEEKV